VLVGMEAAVDRFDGVESVLHMVIGCWECVWMARKEGEGVCWREKDCFGGVCAPHFFWDVTRTRQGSVKFPNTKFQLDDIYHLLLFQSWFLGSSTQINNTNGSTLQ
jgi:hypothetical protein